MVRVSTGTQESSPPSRRRARWGVFAAALALGALATFCAREPERAAPEASAGGERDARGRPPLRPASLGTNLNGVADWTTQDPFLDLYKQARVLVSGTGDEWADGRELPFDERGELLRLEPGQIARTVLLTDHGQYPGGRYVLTYEGEAEFWFHRDVVSQEPGRIVLDVPPGTAPGDKSAVAMDVTSTNADDPLRNVHVYGPGGVCAEDRARECTTDEDCPGGPCQSAEDAVRAGELFRPSFLASLRPYRMLRFMDWGLTNGSEVVRWDDRAQLTDATYTARGVPLERMIELANRTGAQPWFCIPHQADDDYVRQFAALLAAELDPALPVWIEYSNEIWNGIFQQGGYAEAQGEARGYGEELEARNRFQGVRSTEIFDLVDAALGPERVVRVLSVQANWSWVAEQVIAGAEGRADALAVAPYVGLLPGPDDAPAIARAGLDALLERSRDEVLPEALGWVREHAEIARRHGLELVAYEAGQHYVGVDGAQDDESLNALFDRFNRSPAIGEVYTAMLEGWVAAGGGWLNHFVDVSGYSKWGRWGALEYASQPRAEAPKYDALLRFVESHPEGW